MRVYLRGSVVAFQEIGKKDGREDSVFYGDKVK